MPLSHLSESVKHNLDLSFIGIIFGSLISWLPSLSALLSAVWFALRIYETRTVQKILRIPPPRERSTDRKHPQGEKGESHGQ